MKNFVDKYLTGKEDLKILELGSQDVNGSYKPLFNKKGWKYIGADRVEGPNVDVVLKHSYYWGEIKSNSIDVVVSGQVFEHVEFFWHTMLEVSRILKKGGLCCIIAPSNGPEHKYPVDCFRYLPDGFAALARYSSLKTISAYADFNCNEYTDGSNTWKDCVLICEKNKKNIIQRTCIKLKMFLSRAILMLYHLERFFDSEV
jgi:SAM-dependent methyltransferase